jgi:hypothetical protein
MDATLAGKVDVLRATKNSRPRDPDLLAETYNYWGRNGSSWQTCVRDASWHPTAPLIAGKHPRSACLYVSVLTTIPSYIVERLGHLARHLHRAQLERRC